MDLMSPSKNVLNAHIPYVYLAATSLRRGTLDDGGNVSQSTTAAEWLQYSPYINQRVQHAS